MKEEENGDSDLVGLMTRPYAIPIVICHLLAFYPPSTHNTADTHAGSGWPCAAIPTLRHQTATQENQPQKQEQTNKKKRNLIDDDFHICTRLHC